MIKKVLKICLFASVALFLGLLFNCKMSPVHAFTTNPTPTSKYVVDDYDHILDPDTKYDVIQKEKYYKHHTLGKPQVVMMTVPSSHGESIDDYSDDLLEHQRWHFGSKKYNNGVLILFARNHGKNNVRISTGYGVEPILPDLKCNQYLEKNKALLKSNDPSDVNKGLRNVFHEVTHTLDVKYAHLNKKQLMKLKKEHHRARIKKDLEYILIGLIIAILLTPPYNGHWFCAVGWVFDILIIFGGNDDGDDDFGSSGGFTDSGSGGSFGGGGSSI